MVPCGSALLRSTPQCIIQVEENRVQIFFPDKPDQQMRARLKGYGFRWSPTAGAWQRYRSNAGLYWARQCCGAVTDD